LRERERPAQGDLKRQRRGDGFWRVFLKLSHGDWALGRNKKPSPCHLFSYRSVTGQVTGNGFLFFEWAQKASNKLKVLECLQRRKLIFDKPENFSPLKSGPEIIRSD